MKAPAHWVQYSGNIHDALTKLVDDCSKVRVIAWITYAAMAGLNTSLVTALTHHGWLMLQARQDPAGTTVPSTPVQAPCRSHTKHRRATTPSTTPLISPTLTGTVLIQLGGAIHSS